MIVYLIAVPLIAHGLAHLSGVFAPWSRSAGGFADAAWLFSNGVTFHSVASRVFSIIWLTATTVLVLAGIEVLLRQRSWIPMAIAGCMLSLAAILPWWRAVPPGAKVGAAFDLIVLVLLVSPLEKRLHRWYKPFDTRTTIRQRKTLKKLGMRPEGRPHARKRTFQGPLVGYANLSNPGGGMASHADA